jgi:hypothetical protein
MLGCLFGLCATIYADEGMWLFSHVPTEQLKVRYEFEPTDDWIEHVRLASVRFGRGGSASFVSSNGLVITNHHVGARTLQKLSTQKHNYYHDGFHARTRAEEIPAPDLELFQLVSIEDVTERVTATVERDMTTTEAAAARRAVIARIESESLKTTNLRSDVITLYGGGRFHLYRYRRFSDVRLVWSPEMATAFFGGDADNFEYPRYCLDVCLFRAYEDDKPAKIEHFFRVNDAVPKAEQLVFVSGNPYRTERILTTAALRFERDKALPNRLDYLRRREILLQQYSLGGDEQKRRASGPLFGTQNGRKRAMGALGGLQDPEFFALREKVESELRDRVHRRPDLTEACGAWDKIAETLRQQEEMLGQYASFHSQLYTIAETLVVKSIEDEKENEERLPEYRTSGRQSLLKRLFSPAPIYDDLERASLADSLAKHVEEHGADDPFVRQILDGKSPRRRAAELIAGTKLGDVAERRKLAELDRQVLIDSDDPMIQLAWLMQEEWRRLRTARDELEEIERQAYARIADAMFTVYGDSTYPDATGTLRLAFGTIRGYDEDGALVPAYTTIGDAFTDEARHSAEPPWRLPPSWQAAREEIEMATPLNFVSTPDITGGNSGSPVLNRDGELIGLIFDGNLQSLTQGYLYREEPARAVSVHIAAVLELLRNAYDAEHLAEELGR